MKVKLFTCCETCIEDKTSRVISLINLVQEISVVSFPVPIPRLTFVTILEKESEEFDAINVRYQFLIEEELLADISSTLEFKQKLRTRGIARVRGLVIPRPGPLRVHIVEGNTVLASWDIEIIQKKGPQIDLFSQSEGESNSDS